MRSIRMTTGLLLVVAAGVVLLAIGGYAEAVLDARAARSTRTRLRAQARIAAGVASDATYTPRTLVRRVATLAGARATLFDRQGSPLADSTPDHLTTAARPSADVLWKAVSGERTISGEIVTTGSELPDGTVLLLTGPVEPAIDAQRALRGFFFGAFIVLALICWVAALRGWNSVDHALNRVKGVAERLSKGDLTARVWEPRRGPLSDLTAAIDDAIEHLGRLLSDARAQGRYYAAILDQMTDAVVAVDERSRVQFVNRPFARLFDVDPDGTAGRPLENVTLNYDISALVGRALEQGTVQRDSLTLTHPDEYTLECVATPLTDGDEVIGAVALLHDITQLREAHRVRQDFVANASHELRTPAAGIKALAEALEAGALDDPERGPKFCEQIVEAADRLTEILDDMLTLTRVERGARLLEPRLIDVATALEDAANQVRPGAHQKQVSVTCEVAEGDQVYADPDALQTLLLNLLDNAVKYTPQGGSVTARGRAVPGGYELAVIDTGVGIPKDHQDRIFERFYRVDRARDRTTGSTGLGLSIVKHLAESHEGHVNVRSIEGEGSTFTAFFPEAPASEGLS